MNISDKTCCVKLLAYAKGERSSLMHRLLSIMIILVLACSSAGFVSTNVPLNHWSYEALDKLTGAGLIDSAMLTSKPASRLEIAANIAEALEKARQRGEDNHITLAILERLKSQFRPELVAMGSLEGEPVDSFFKPVENPYAKYVFADKETGLENLRGDVFKKDSNYRLGFASRIKFSDTVAFYFHPEYLHSSSTDDADIDLVEGYGKISFGNLEIEAGRDSLWWGPAYHGSMLMTNNAAPFKMIKISNPHPKPLPWIFEGLGLCKTTWFLTELEKDRAISHVKLTGLRCNFKPHPAVEFGLSRTIMFGGSSVPHVGLRDYLDMFRPQAEQPENNQLAGFDVSLLLPLHEKAPIRSLRLYTDMAGEDEASGAPSKWGSLFGAQFYDILRTGRTDLRVEYANNHVSGHPNVFYTHSLYQSGYTYKDRIIGHHMGTDSRDLFIRLTHYLAPNLILGLEFNREKNDLSSSPRITVDKFGFDLTLFTRTNWQLKTAYRHENAKDRENDNDIFSLCVIRHF